MTQPYNLQHLQAIGTAYIEGVGGSQIIPKIRATFEYDANDIDIPMWRLKVSCRALDRITDAGTHILKGKKVWTATGRTEGECIQKVVVEMLRDMEHKAREATHVADVWTSKKESVKKHHDLAHLWTTPVAEAEAETERHIKDEDHLPQEARVIPSRLDRNES